MFGGDASPPSQPPATHNKPMALQSGLLCNMANFSTLHVPATETDQP
jgi:hypothetical protein